MSKTLLQFDFPFQGPWGAEMPAAMEGLAADIASEPGFLWKIWTENAETGRAGGIYLFASPEEAEAYRVKHAARLEGFGITGITAHAFAVNDALSAITKAPL
ncbi:monooxygenase [Xinfangfangia sp. D13-10-4-6]|uniref:monooxygenase n=1 Tax=Pseudogemmobacter hezensis TaxID=2737662 RepID=UPI001553A488|nr:monooxygenase [Pseudogemmobacter hezensis]NPD15421.1 monooxygenase [Pseudogemmobacter hezensis]